ncbi:MAG TPA: Maf family protein [Geothermobacteraceae bacterium]|nr:Maf family protein [Geothermobacteraceae bacterium]
MPFSTLTPNAPLLILASASPRRQEFLQRLGYTFQSVPSRVDESVLPEEAPEAHVIRLSRDKALEVAGRRNQGGRFFLGSDTIVLCDRQILGKPSHADEATQMLRLLSGREHTVVTGYAIHDRQAGRTLTGKTTTRVTFRHLSADEIDGYVATGEPFDKAGSYAIQGGAAGFVSRITGSYTNVVGLPLAEVVEALVSLGMPRPFSRDSASETESMS